MNYIDRRDEYRAYLTTPLWQSIRQKALGHYGCVCARCGEHGTDIHHKTYERVGGNEKLEDLEVLCRPCHDAHHRIDKISTPKGKKKRRKKARRGMHITGALNYLTKDHKRIMADAFTREYYITALSYTDEGRKIRDKVMELLGIDYLHGFKIADKSKRKSIWPAFQPKGGELQKSSKFQSF